MGKGSGKRAFRKRVADVPAAAHEDAEQPQRATRRRLAKLERDLAAAHKTEERLRSRLVAASAGADRVRSDIVELVRHASGLVVGGARMVGHAAGDGVAMPDGVPTAARPLPPAKPAAPRQRRARSTTPPAPGPENG